MIGKIGLHTAVGLNRPCASADHETPSKGGLSSSRTTATEAAKMRRMEIHEAVGLLANASVLISAALHAIKKRLHGTLRLLFPVVPRL